MAQVREAPVTATIHGTRMKSVARASQRTHVHDIVCVGFGINALALAIALKEIRHDTDIVFLERQSHAHHVPSMHLKGRVMQLSFLNDLVTLENPRSKFSYISYLHATDQLIQFTNLGSIQPLREQFTRYLGWCADQFRPRVRYGSAVQAVRGVVVNGPLVDAWSVEYTDVQSGQVGRLLARRVVCAGQPRPSVPAWLSQPNMSGSVVHSSDYARLLDPISRASSRRHHIVVMGNGQEAAEMVEHLCSMPRQHQVTWIQTSRTRVSTNIDAALTHRLTERHYLQRIDQADPARWVFQIHSITGLASVSKDASGKIHLAYTRPAADSASMGTVCDLVIAATGYETCEYGELLESVGELLWKDQVTVDPGHKVNLKPDMVRRGCGIWALDSSTETDRDGDEFLAQIASSSRRLAESLTEQLRIHHADHQPAQPRL